MLVGEVDRVCVRGAGRGGSGEHDGDGGEDEVVWWGWSE